MAGVFKAYDVRGLCPEEVNENLAYALGYNLRGILDADDLARGERVVVSHDMRPTSPRLAAALSDGLRTAGLAVTHIGLATTPMNYFAVGFLGASAGVQVTASHNPAQYNGLKVSRRDAIPVSYETGIGELERLISQQPAPPPEPHAAIEHRDITEAYRRHVLSFLRGWEPRLKVAVDVANGMATLYRDFLGALNIEVVPLFFGLDGSFPNHEANPLKPENTRDLREAVRAQGCAFGVAFDGDADRAILVDDQGVTVGADLLTALLAAPVLARHPGATIVYDVRSSRATAEAIREAGGVPLRERVGHSFIKATMRRVGSPFGGELAGHFYYRDNYYADSAFITVVEALNLVREKGSLLSELLLPLRRYASTGEINFHVDDKDKMLATLAATFSDGAIDRLDGITVEYPAWWFNVRPSNTEPLLRLVLEAESPALLSSVKAKMLAILGRPEGEA